MSVNKVILIGNLGKDPEVRHTNDGMAIVTLRIATSESWKDRSTGERKEKTEWHQVVIFNENLAKVAQNYLKKGAKVYIEGALQTRKWADKEGIERYTTEIVLKNYNGTLTMLDGRDGGSGEAGKQEGNESYSDQLIREEAERLANEGGRTRFKDQLNDDIPF